MQPPTNPKTCTACLDPLPGPHLLIDTNPLCHACFRHLFTLALSSEASYPASWAGRTLSATRYAHILGPELLAGYTAKATEYACPPQERVYCSRTDPPRRLEACGQFMGRWSGVVSSACCVKCEACAWFMCLRCEESFSTGEVEGVETAIEHECDPRRDLELEERAFRGLKRGREWQLCPNEVCKRRVELSDGCNHMRCVCRMHFCFLCGKPVKDGDGHWRKDEGCPRFGQKESERAIYDEEDVWNDNDDVSDEERALEFQRAEDGEEQALRRAYELQMAEVEELRRELDQAEAARMRGRPWQGEAIVAGPLDGQRRHRRRRPREDREMNDQQRRERHHVRRRVEEHPLPDARQPRGLRAFINNAIDATESVLFGDAAPRRH